jgi:hypothetical protein
MALKPGMAKNLGLIAAAAAGVLIYQSLKPLPQPTPANCKLVQGVVEKVYNNIGDGDLTIRLKNDDGYYYINRGLDKGLTADILGKQLLEMPVAIFYIKHWSLINLGGKSRHIARIETGGKVLYNEWKKN